MYLELNSLRDGFGRSVQLVGKCLLMLPPVGDPSPPFSKEAAYSMYLESSSLRREFGPSVQSDWKMPSQAASQWPFSKEVVEPLSFSRQKPNLFVMYFTRGKRWKWLSLLIKKDCRRDV